MSFTKKINIFLNDALSQGVVDQDSKEKLQNFAKNYEQKSLISFVNLVGFFGGFAIILGLILTISHNWNKFSNLTKFSVYIFMLIGFYIFAYLLGKKNPKTSQIIYFVIAGYILAGIYLIIKIYNLNGKNGEACLIWFCMILPMAILLRDARIGLMAMLSFYYWILINANFNFYHNAFGNNMKNQILFFTTFFSSMILFPKTFSRIWETFKHISFFGYFILGLMTFLLSFIDELTSTKINIHPYLIIMIIFNIMCLTNNFIRLSPETKRRSQIIQMPEFTIILLNIISLFAFTNQILTSILYSFVWFAGFGVMIYRGEIERSKTMINIGTWCIMIGLIAKFFDYFRTMLFTGSMFILFGAVLILIAYLGEKYRKNLINKIFKNHVI